MDGGHLVTISLGRTGYTLYFYVCSATLPVEGGGISGSPQSDLPQGTLDLLILKAVAVEPIHGYAIAQRLELVSRGVVQVPEGSLYPALHRLENRGFLAAEWKKTENRP